MFQIPKLSEDLLDFVYVNLDKLIDRTYYNYLQTIRPKDTLLRCSDILPMKVYKVFPRLDKALHLQEDMLILGDIYKLWKTKFFGGTLLSIVRPMHSIQTHKLAFIDSVEIYKLFQYRYNKSLNDGVNIYDTSVSMFNLAQWKQKREYLESEINYWIKAAIKHREKHGDLPWWMQGSDILLQLFMQDQITILPFTHWHINGLGQDEVAKLSPRTVAKAKLMHWDGPNKPWDSSDALYWDYWKAHIPSQRACPNLALPNQNKRGGIFNYLKSFFKQSDWNLR